MPELRVVHDVACYCIFAEVPHDEEQMECVKDKRGGSLKYDGGYNGGEPGPEKTGNIVFFFHPAGLHLFFFSNPAERFADLASDEIRRSVCVTTEESILQLWVQQQTGKINTQGKSEAAK